MRNDRHIFHGHVHGRHGRRDRPATILYYIAGILLSCVLHPTCCVVDASQTPKKTATRTAPVASRGATPSRPWASRRHLFGFNKKTHVYCVSNAGNFTTLAAVRLCIVPEYMSPHDNMRGKWTKFQLLYHHTHKYHGRNWHSTTTTGRFR